MLVRVIVVSTGEERQLTVDRAKDTASDIRRRVFGAELASGKSVRLVCNGTLLDDSKSVRDLDGDPPVVHAVVTRPFDGPPDAPAGAGEQAMPGRHVPGGNRAADAARRARAAMDGGSGGGGMGGGMGGGGMGGGGMGGGGMGGGGMGGGGMGGFGLVSGVRGMCRWLCNACSLCDGLPRRAADGLQRLHGAPLHDLVRDGARGCSTEQVTGLLLLLVWLLRWWAPDLVDSLATAMLLLFSGLWLAVASSCGTRWPSSLFDPRRLAAPA